MTNAYTFESISLKQIHVMLREILHCINTIAIKNNITYYLHAGTALGAVRHGDIIPWDEDADIIVPINDYQKFVELISKDLNPKYELKYKSEDCDVMQAKIVLSGDNTGIICVDIFPLIGVPEQTKKQKKLLAKSIRIRKIYRLKRLGNTESSNALKAFLKKAISFFCSVYTDKTLYKMFDCSILKKYDYSSSQYVTNPCGGYGMKNVIKKEVYGTPLLLKFFGEDFPLPEKTDEYLKHYYGDYMKLPAKEKRETIMNQVKILRVKTQEH